MSYVLNLYTVQPFSPVQHSNHYTWNKHISYSISIFQIRNGKNIAFFWSLCTKSLKITSLCLSVRNIVLSLRELSLSSLMIIILISVSLILQALGYNSSKFDLKLKKSSFLNASSCIHQHIIHTLQNWRLNYQH